MQKIVFLERNTFTINFPRPRFEHEWIEFGETRADQIVERLQGATIAICNKLPLRESELSRLPGLKLIAVAATGVDNIDLDYCRDHEIAVCNARNYAGHSLPEHVFMLILALRRNLTSYLQDVRQGRWHTAKQFCLLDYPIRNLHGSTIGILGFGFLGRAVAQMARAFGMQVVVAEHKNAVGIREGRLPFEQVLEQSDIVTLHCPLNESTVNLLGKRELQQMKRDALLINTARGALVDAASLAHVLREGLIGGAGVDVLSLEPPADGNPLLEPGIPNLLITPHIGWASSEAMHALANQLVGSIESFMRGESRNRIV